MNKCNCSTVTSLNYATYYYSELIISRTVFVKYGNDLDGKCLTFIAYYCIIKLRIFLKVFIYLFIFYYFHHKINMVLTINTQNEPLRGSLVGRAFAPSAEVRWFDTRFGQAKDGEIDTRQCLNSLINVHYLREN